MFKIFEPNKIFQITSKAPKYILFLFVVVLTVGLTEALILSPEDYKQSDAVRIMFMFHQHGSHLEFFRRLLFYR